MINEIHNENCLATMARMGDNFLDLTVTSPPYNKNGASGALVKEVVYSASSDKINEAEYQEMQIRILNEIYLKTKDNGALFYNHKVRYSGYAIHPMEWILRSKWNLHQEIIWNRKLTGNIRGWRLYHTDERIYWLVKKKPKELSQKLAQLTSVWDIRPEMKRIGHPAPFPEEIAKRCILLGSNEGDIVYDPFMGSGTTAKMAIKNGRNWIGSEISGEYCKIIEDRISNLDNPTLGSLSTEAIS